MKHTRLGNAVAIAVTAFAIAITGSGSAGAMPAPIESRVCPPDAIALTYSDGLNKLTYQGIELGGLSDIAYDARSHAYVSSVDNNGTDPSRLWFYRNLTSPVVVRPPLILRAPDGKAYDGTTADNEGLAVLPDGDYLVSSETEPSIRIYGRNGLEKTQLRVPTRFHVAPAGQATTNKTLEGLTVTPNGRRIIAAMEGTLSGDVSATGDATYRRFLIYDRNRRGTWKLKKEVGYQVDPGNRISEVQAYDNGKIVVMEAAYSAAAGNTVQLYAVTGLGHAPNVTRVGNLSAQPDDVLSKTLVTNITDCPSLGAPAKETQTNPLLDNYEGMTIRRLADTDLYAVSLISDDNFSPTQTTRLLNLAAVLP